jgi:PAS domain S-box-containing protein
VESSTKTFGYASNGSRSDDDRQGVDFRRVADTVPASILVADADGKVLYANKRFVAALGGPLEELIGEGWLESIEATFREEAKARWYDCIRTRTRLDVIWRFRVSDGTYRWQHLRAEPSSHEESGDASWYLVGVDVDEQFKAREALQASVRPGRSWTVCRR